MYLLKNQPLVDKKFGFQLEYSIINMITSNK
jgi:hypothetical protein